MSKSNYKSTVKKGLSKLLFLFLNASRNDMLLKSIPMILLRYMKHYVFKICQNTISQHQHQ